MITRTSVATEVDGEVCVISMRSADGLNVLTEQTRDELADALREADGDPAVRSLVLQGEERAFSVGASLEEFPPPDADPTDYVRRAMGVIGMPERLGKPVVAAVRGQAIAGGCELALACDWIVAAEAARFALPEAHFGFAAGYVSARLPAAIGVHRSRRILMTGESFSAMQAAAWGLQVTPVPAGLELDEALALARSFGRTPAHTLRTIKSRSAALAALTDPDLKTSLSAYVEAWNHPETIAAIARFRSRHHRATTPDTSLTPEESRDTS